MIEESLASALGSLFTGGFWADTAPAETAMPFCVYTQVGGRPSNTVCGNTTHQNVRIQFTVWCDTAAGGRAQANTLMRQLEDVVTSSPLYGVSQGSLAARYDEMTRRYGAMQDFSFWF